MPIEPRNSASSIFRRINNGRPCLPMYHLTTGTSPDSSYAKIQNHPYRPADAHHHDSGGSMPTHQYGIQFRRIPLLQSLLQLAIRLGEGRIGIPLHLIDEIQRQGRFPQQPHYRRQWQTRQVLRHARHPHRICHPHPLPPLFQEGSRGRQTLHRRRGVV